jgi:hypothetical protein
VKIMKKYFKFYSALLVFVLTGCFHQPSGYHSDPFYLRYEKASDILYGEVGDVHKLDGRGSVKEFSSIKGEVSKIDFNIIESFKGQQSGMTSFLANISMEITPSEETVQKSITPPAGTRVLIYLRQVENVAMAEIKFGFIPITDLDHTGKKSEITALRELAKGKPMSQVVSRLGADEEQFFIRDQK